jgi:hypothetical protein
VSEVDNDREHGHLFSQTVNRGGAAKNAAAAVVCSRIRIEEMAHKARVETMSHATAVYAEHKTAPSYEVGGNTMSLRHDGRLLAIMATSLFFVAITMHGQASETSPTTETEADSTNAATNPATPKVTLQAWDNWLLSPSGTGGRGGNALLSRNIIPIRIFNVMNLIHVEEPIDTNPTIPGGTQTGLGGTIIYNFSAVKVGTTTYGAGPLVILPSETSSHFGPEKWQAGVAGLIMHAPKWGLLGGIFTYQHSFGKGPGSITEEATFQNFIHFNLGHGTFLQSEGATQINSGRGVRVVPVGLGIGRAWAYSSGATFSCFLEPQYSVWRRGVGAPTWQFFSGISVQVPVEFKLWDR